MGTLAALAAARGAAPGRRAVVASEHVHSSVDKARGSSSSTSARFRSTRPTGCAPICSSSMTPARSSRPRHDVERGGRPVPAIADACEAAGTWLHVDAAYAGSAAVCEELRPLFAGWERGDSIVVNPHKWLSTPMDCSALWTRRVDAFRAVFSLVPEYLRVTEEVVSLNEVAVPLGRRFRALKLWVVLRTLGREGLQAMIREHIRLAVKFERWVADEPGWEVCAPRRFSLVCFRREGTDADNEALLDASTRAARSSSRTRVSTAASCCAWRSTTPARPRTTSASPGTCCSATPRARRRPARASEPRSAARS